jgi:hypothetical protein
MDDNPEIDHPPGIMIRAILPEEGKGLDADQQRKLAHKVVDMLEDAGFICDLIIPSETE